MADNSETDPDLQGAPEVSLASRLRSKFGEDLLSSIIKGILAALAALGLIVWHPIWQSIQRVYWTRHNISLQAANDIAHSHLDAGAIWTVPFRNIDDPLQYIVTWTKMIECEKPADCPNGEGLLSAHLLSGRGATYSDIDLQLPTAARWQGAADENREQQAILTGVTDWNKDGKKEILSISIQTAFTSPIASVYLTLFDTSSGHVNQLQVNQSATENSETLVGPDEANPKLRSWLLERAEEYFTSIDREQCSRVSTGQLRCNRQSAVSKTYPEEAKGELHDRIAWDRVALLQKEWLISNGPNFTTGPIKLRYEPGILGQTNKGELCRLEPGRYELLNYFKGPLVLNDLQKQRSSVLYQQDGNHHREIPTLVVGKRYVWMGLAVDNHILAIKRDDWTVVPFDVPQWLVAAPTDLESSEAGTKEMQIPLFLENGTLVYVNWTARSIEHKAISPQPDWHLDPDEFKQAWECPRGGE